MSVAETRRLFDKRRGDTCWISVAETPLGDLEVLLVLVMHQLVACWMHTGAPCRQLILVAVDE